MTPPDTEIVVPLGFRLAGVHCGIKSNPANEDLALVVCDRPATAVGVYTQNRVRAAPVQLDAERTPNNHTRAVLVNSGNANACTGARGIDDAVRMTELAATVCGTAPEDVLVMSTGIIGSYLPMDRIASGVRLVAEKLSSDHEGLVSAARGMMTTDTVHKLASRTVQIDGASVHITGLAKGAAMIGPNMATMLGVVLTDAAIAPDAAQQLLTACVDETFNCISVDGHMSTNDTVLLLASGHATGQDPGSSDVAEFRTAMHQVCRDLARSIPADGEGATHLIIIDVTGCTDKRSAKAIAKTVAGSPLVKTAVAGGDPNWGRIISAAGYAGVDFDVGRVELHINDALVFQDGSPAEFDAAEVSASMRCHTETSIRLTFGDGQASARVWSSDLTSEYVRINADYHT